MIGFQCAAAASAAGKPVEQQQQQQQQQEASSSVASSPASRRSSASSSSSASSCTPASSARDLAGRLAGHLHQQLPSIQHHDSHSLGHQKTLHSGPLGESEERELGAGSPGYHSAAPSPGGSTSSSVASPISSSASSSSTSVCSSSGVSTASRLSAASTHSSAGLQQQRQSPITTTASSTHQQPQKQPLHLAAAGGSSSDAIGPLTSQQMSQQLVAPAMQQQANPYESLMRAQQPRQQQQHQRNTNQQANGLGALLDHFPEARHDALNLSWFHEANNRAALNAALGGPKLIVAGDISLAEMSRYPVPIMARPPLGVSDLTLESWITEVLQARKGIKLTFTSTRTVEPAFRVLARHADQLRGPLVLSADILAWPQSAGCQPANKHQQQQQPVDAWTFLMLCRTRFPKSIISIGWCGGASSARENAPVDSAIGQPESLFDLDLMEQPQQQQQHQFSSPVLHLSQQSRAQHHQPLAAFQPHAALLNRHLLQTGRPAQFGNSSCASSGSLASSSSGNSSGSPSPTSPVSSSNLFGASLAGGCQSQQGAAAQRVRHHQRLMHMAQPLGGVAAGPGEHLIAAAAAAAAVHEHNLSGPQAAGAHLKGGWSAMAAAAMVAQLQQQQQQHDPLPLNLNINEAEPKHAVARLQELAQTIQQLQQQQQQQQQRHSSDATAAALALASNILQANSGNPHTDHAHQLLVSQLREAQKWEHVSKKAAVSNRLNSNSPSPISTSPKQQPASAINLLSCVSTPASAGKSSNHRAPSGPHQLQRQHPHQLQHEQQQPQPQPQPQHTRMPQQQQPDVPAYTPEMIDTMSNLVKAYNLTQAVTFPVEARWLVRRHSAYFAHSLTQLQRLLSQVGPNSTLTLIAQPEDLISADELQLIRKHFTPSQILFDLPGELAQALKQHDSSTSGGDR